ncbi:ribosome maturation factor RimP [Tahibacter harae]|uniref:Ribosome maturation factor RimP n=1 Tax=Tahibacter harae TaxID=2963937 RepID=A0ABT1QKU0_9GAMM|nr:ribosome maturation factor RimP [Tahibacter harae]
MKDDELIQLINPVVADLGLECLGIEYAPSRGNSLLRIYIDHLERPITIEDCEAVSRELSAQFDVNDPIAGRYTLEVSSPGLDRPLFTPAQFARFIGEKAKIALNLPVEGRRRLQGAIRAVDGDRITIDQDGVDITIAHDNVQKARIVPDYAALGLAPEKPAGKPKPQAKPGAAKPGPAKPAAGKADAAPKRKKPNK